MSHSPTAASGIQIDDPEAGSTWVVALASVIVLAALIVATCVFYFHFETVEVTDKVIDAPNKWATAIKNEQMSQLAIYQKYTVTAPDGSTESRIRIPISRAIELVATDANKPASVAAAPAAAGTPTK